MADVYEGEYCGKRVAVKRLRAHLKYDLELRQLFADECQLLRDLAPCNFVPKVIATGESEGDLFLAQELLQGCDFKAVISTLQRGLEAQLWLQCAASLFNALAHIHESKLDSGEDLNVVHRDISPENIFWCEDGTFKFIDFGVAANIMRTHKTTQGEIKGKFQYMAPEQTYGDRPVTQAIDVYALGIVLHELLKGRPVFEESTDADLVFAIRENKKDPIPTDSLFVRNETKELFEKICSLAPEHRPSAREVADVLERTLGEAGAHRGLKRNLSKYFRTEIQTKLKSELTAEGITSNPVQMRSRRNQTQKVIAISDSKTEPTPNKNSNLRIPILAAGGLAVITFLFFGTANWFRPSPVEQRLGPSPIVSSERNGTRIQPTIAETNTIAAGQHEESALSESIKEQEIKKASPGISSPSQESKKIAKEKPRTLAGRRKTTEKSTTRTQKGALRTKARSPGKHVSFGTLSLNSEPWGEIWLDGKKTTKTTPAMNWRLPTGKHRLRIVNPESNLQHSLTVVVTPNQAIKEFAPLK